MNLSSRLFAAILAAVPVTLAAQSAFAADPCGNFNLDYISKNGISCKIEVEGGCTAQCTPLSFEAGCTGQCTGTATTDCTASCGTQCVAQCDPAKLDCFTGCHEECDAPVQEKCAATNPGEDCVSIARAQCDMHCNTQCEVVTDTNCQEHCQTCCTGSCTTQVNYDCDYQCFATLQGGCDVQCEKPDGALFCNGQFVNAADVDACITFLANQGITVDVTARGEVKCDLNGCDGTGSAAAGVCSVSNVGMESAAASTLSLGVLGLAMGLGARRRKKGEKKAS